MTMFSQVSKMNIAFGNPFGGATHERVLNQIKNLKDEFEELQDAISRRYRVEVRDAACDLLVFAFGAFHLMGIDYDHYVSSAPRVKVRALEGDVYLHLETLSKDFMVNYEGLEKSIRGGDLFWMVAGYVEEIIDFALKIHQLVGLDVEADMTAVYESNMSKFCKNDNELAQTLAKYRVLGLEVYHQGSYPTICVKSSCDQKDIKGENYPKGKFLKGVAYKKPVFA